MAVARWEDDHNMGRRRPPWWTRHHGWFWAFLLFGHEIFLAAKDTVCTCACLASVQISSTCKIAAERPPAVGRQVELLCDFSVGCPALEIVWYRNCCFNSNCPPVVHHRDHPSSGCLADTSRTRPGAKHFMPIYLSPITITSAVPPPTIQSIHQSSIPTLLHLECQPNSLSLSSKSFINLQSLHHWKETSTRESCRRRLEF